MFDDFNRQSVQALVDVFLQRIIHKAMARNPRFASENRTFNPDSEMCAHATVIGSRMACMGSTFV